MNAIKSLSLRAVAAGIALPENPVCRLLELQHLRKLLTLLKVNCVLDVGANQGQFATELRRIGYHGRLVSFEPVSSVYAILQKAFSGDTQWRGFPIGQQE